MMNELTELINDCSSKFYFKSKSGVLPVEYLNDKYFILGEEVANSKLINELKIEHDKVKKKVEKTYERIMNDLESFGIWDSGNLSIDEEKILNWLLVNKKVKRESGISGIHDTFNGTAKYVYSLTNPVDNLHEMLYTLNKLLD